MNYGLKTVGNLTVVLRENNMPIKNEYGGHGEEVMKDMKKTYGKDKGKSVFYATMNKAKKNKSAMKEIFK